MADFNSDDQELTAPFEEEIGDFLQADLNLRPVDWATTSTELLNDGENIVSEENICETVVEEIILEQENENYLTGLEGNCMENSIVYLFEDPVADYSLDEPEFVIEESLTYDLEEEQPLETNLEPEIIQVDVAMDSNSSQDTVTSRNEDNCTSVQENEHKDEGEGEEEEEDYECENALPETSLENSVNNYVNSNSDSDSDRDSVQSTSLKDNINNSELCASPQQHDGIIAGAYPEPNPNPDQEDRDQDDLSQNDYESKLSEYQSPKANRFRKNSDSSPQSYTPLKEYVKSSSQTDLEASPATSVSSVKASVLGKEQIKKRLQSFSLMKLGIQPVPIKKIMTKSPKIQVQLQSDTYDELGNKIDEKLVIIKKPPKQGPTPQERARAVIDEIEQIKREEQLIYEENLSFISNSMRKSMRKGKKPITAEAEIEIKNFVKHKPFVRKPRNYRGRRSADKEKNDRIRNKSREMSSEKSRDSIKELDDKKAKEKEREREKEKEMPPRTWADVKLRNMKIEEICALKEKMFKVYEKNFKKGLKRFEEEEKIYPFRKDDYIKPQIMFEELSLIRNPLPALGVNGLTKYYPSDVIKFTEKLPIITYCENPTFSFDLNKPRKVVMSENTPKRNELMMKIIEGKTGKTNIDLSVKSSTTRNWYPKTEYFNEPKPVVCAANAKSTNALLVLSEMYDDEEDADTDKDKHKKMREKRPKLKVDKKKSKSKKKKSKKRKRKLKSKSRSHSKEKHKAKHDHSKNDKKSKRKSDSKEKHSKSEEKSVPAADSATKKSTTSSTAAKDKTNKTTTEQHLSVKTKSNTTNERCSKDVGVEDTPNTDEYRSNWESDLDMDIIPEGPFSKNRDSASLDQNWESEEEKRTQFENKRKSVNSDDKRKSRRSLSLERANKKQQDVKRNYRSSFLIDLELEEKKKRTSTSDKSEAHDTNKRSSRDDRNISLERDKKSSRTRNESSEKHQNTSEHNSHSKKPIEDKVIENMKKSEERKSSERRSRSKDFKLDDSSVDKKKSASDKHETKASKGKSRHSEEKSHGPPRSERRRSHSNDDHKTTRKSHEDNRKSHDGNKKSTAPSNKNEEHKRRNSREKSKPEITVTKTESDEHKAKEENVVNHKTLAENAEEEAKNKREKSRERNDSLKSSQSNDRSINEEKPERVEDTKEKKGDDEKNDSEMKQQNEFNIDAGGDATYNKWSSEEDLHNKRKSSVDKSDTKLNVNYSRSFQWSDDEDYDRKRNVNEHLNKVRSKYRWEDDLETQCRNLEAEIQKKREDLSNYRNIEEFHKVKYKKDDPRSYRNKTDSEEKSKTRDTSKKSKKKSKEKDKNKPKITLNYSDFEDSIEAGLTEKVEKKPPKDSLFDANEIFTKYKAKIKIDYTDFDLSLNECKEKFEDKGTKNLSLDQSSSVLLPTTAPVKKMNFDFSEILNTSQTQVNSVLTETPKAIVEEVKVIEKIEPAIVADIKPLVDVQKPVIPSVLSVNSIAEISPVVPPVTLDAEPSIPTPDPNKLVSEYEEFMKAVCFDDTPVPTNEADKKISERDESKDLPLSIPLPPLPLPLPLSIPLPLPLTLSQSQLQPQLEKESKKDEDINEAVDDDDYDDEDSSSSSSSSDLTDSDSDDSSDVNSSASELSEMSDTTVLKTVANIKTEVLSDSENDFMDKRKEKRKRNEVSESESALNKLAIKKESENISKKPKLSNAAFDKNLIEWESSLTTKKMTCDLAFNPVHQSEIDVFDIAPSTVSVLPENIPLPQDNTIGVYSKQMPTLNDYMYGLRAVHLSPKQMDTISISSESTPTTPSPLKRSQAFTARKALPPEAEHAWNLGPEHYEYTPKSSYYSQDDKALFQIVSSSDTSNTDSAVNTVSELMEGSPNMRKRQSHWNLNLTPVKKPMLLNPAPAFNEEDSDEDFTDKFAKSPEKKIDKQLPATVHSKVDTPPTEIKDIKEPTKTKQSDKEKSDKEKTKSNSESIVKADVKSDKNRKSSSDKEKKDKKEIIHNKKEKSRERSTERSSSNKEREREKEQQRDRDKRRSLPKTDRRLSDRKSDYAKSNRSKYSRDRSPIRSRSSGHERSRERSKEKSRNDRRDSRDIRDRSRTTYRRDKYSRSLSPPPNRTNTKQKQDYRSLPLPQIRPDDTDFSTHSMELVHSPMNSPLDGFKRSLADSTISDSELLTQQITPDESEQSPGYSQMPKPFYPGKELPVQRLESPSSPKRISLDDRINLVLGIEKEPPKSIDTVCSRGPFTNTIPNYHDPYAYARHDYEVYNAQSAEQYPPVGPYHPYPQPYYQNQVNTESNVKVVQVGNVIQVVPTDQPIVPAPHPGPSPGTVPTQSAVPAPVSVPAPVPITPVAVAPPKSTEMPPKVVQVGNMLQIVPMTIMEMATTNTTTSPLSTTTPSTPIPDPVAAPKPIDQLVLERRAEKEKRRVEREQRRLEKEKKRKEKEKRRQMKIKLKTENMIKKALMLEAGEGELDISNLEAEAETDASELPVAWPPSTSTILSLPLPRQPSKGILISQGFRDKDDSLEESDIRKVVKFADGICPGEGTSPSGGEELPSPPPPPRKLPKEKRYKKLKLNKGKNKKKVKVKIIRTQPPSDSSDTEDNLPPPPPPPGSPPPHLWPPRIKQPPVNNIHPQLNIPGSNGPIYPPPGPAYAPPPQMAYPGGYPPGVVMGQSPMPLLPGPGRNHHPPVIPVLQPGGHHGPHHGAPPSYH